ncbi:hypothetical protein D187_003239 [Cystobacter fuscus DSM 2262]|uniref:Uncharacterized protein n=1 Tax=Cystobacter fuscus (strain ATCC 25194 / DSM 2262 / NBRC 100088 / M29) TaxID=1242864 RepID=S9PA67_CYSF2|nr:hypothetical protein [Cystobacter fuscus]EPX59137.1 hypothetical protein D187_003239 [Cystobacter fuscus DSM 2262]WNG30898.1 hypothetical protein F0U62_47950 [Cystobacter fuscus]
MKRFVIVFDNEPADSAPWIASACASSRLTFVDNEAIINELAQNKDARPLLTGNTKENPQLAPFYKAALDKVAGDNQRVGLYSTSWLLYLGQADACVLDFAGLEEQRMLALATGMAQKIGDEYVAKYSALLQDKARKVLPPERILVLPAKEKAARKAELAAAFIQKLG